MSQTPREPALDAPPRRRSRWLSVLLAFFLLSLGFVGGVGATIYVVSSHLMDHLRDPSALPRLLTMRLDQRLDLDDEQEQAVEAILQQRLDRLHRLVYASWDPFIEPHLQSLHDQIALVLNAEQKRRWARAYARIREQWLHKPGKPPPTSDPLEGLFNLPD
jgi:hypothetical protein